MYATSISIVLASWSTLNDRVPLTTLLETQNSDEEEENIIMGKAEDRLRQKALGGKVTVSCFVWATSLVPIVTKPGGAETESNSGRGPC